MILWHRDRCAQLEGEHAPLVAVAGDDRLLDEGARQGAATPAHRNGDILLALDRIADRRCPRLNDDTLLYEFTVEDPTAFTRAWTAQIPMKRSDSALYEYACHEGNYGMSNLLAGARADERAAADAGR